MFLGRYSLTRDRHASFAMLVISESRPAAEVQQRGLGLDTRGQWLDPLSRGECWAGREKAHTQSRGLTSKNVQRRPKGNCVYQTLFSSIN